MITTAEHDGCANTEKRSALELRYGELEAAKYDSMYVDVDADDDAASEQPIHKGSTLR